MVKAILFVVIILSILVVVSCTPAREENDSGKIPLLNESGNVTNESAINSTGINPSGACTPQWRCISSRIKAYQLGNCSFTSRLECPLGCFNDSCRIAQTCTPGFGCVNDHIKGYQMESCQWTSETNCDWKCENGECISKPENYTEPAAESPNTAPAPISMRSVAIGGTDNITVNGVDYSVSIYALEPDRVRMVVDDLRSDWVMEGDTVIFSNGVTLVVKEILFQSFSGGKRQVGYTVG